MNRNLQQIPAKLRNAFTCFQEGRIDSARITLEEILKLQPKCLDALNLLGVIAARSKNHERALTLFDRAIALDQRISGPFSNKGLLLCELGQFEAALDCFDRAIAINSDDAVVRFNRANVLKQLDRPNDALQGYEKAITIKPDFAQAHYNRGVLLKDLGRHDEALASYDSAVRSRAGYAEAFFNRGNLLLEMGRHAAALENFDRAIECRSAYAEAYLNRGDVLQKLGRTELALRSYDRAIAIRPNYIKAHYNRGNLFKSLNRRDGAVASYNQCLEIDSSHADAHFNKALVHLAHGEFDAGWIEHEWRWRNSDAPAAHQIKHYDRPLWLGRESLTDKTILLHCEQGLGDTIHFCRYASLVAARGANVVLLVPRALARLLHGLDGVTRLVADGDPLPEFDYHCPLMSLPLALDTRLDNIPSSACYLRAESGLVRAWHTRLGPRSRPRIGLVWYGSRQHARDSHRSVSLRDMIHFLPAGLDYFSLHKEISEDDAPLLQVHPACAMGTHPTVSTFPGELDFANTAALIDCLDLVISVDTSIAHLSAALGMKTWILLSFHPDWRWLLERRDSPWYPSVNLYRQATEDDWSPVFASLRRDLAEVTSYFQPEASNAIRAPSVPDT